MADAKMNLVRIWKLVAAYFEDIDFPTEVAALALARSVDSGNASDATYYDERNPEFAIIRNENAEHEDRLPLISLEPLNWPHDTPEKATSNHSQRWSMDIIVRVKTIGPTQDDADIRCLDAISVVVNSWLGAGSRLGGVNRDLTGFDASVLQSGGWIGEPKDDQFTAIGQLILTVRMRVSIAPT